MLLDGGDCPADALTALVGERGRLLRLARVGEPHPAVPPGFRVVHLARSPGFFAPFEVLSIGWDLERARADRHRTRGSDDAERRASVSRRRWQGVDPERWANQVAAHAPEDGIPTG